MTPHDSPFAEHVARLHGCMPGLLAGATQRALRLHADAVSLEHLMGAVMQAEECAAYSVVEHAFADPETIGQELLALSSGIMVVASGSALPFSPLAVDALGAAHAQAAQTADGKVTVGAVLYHACGALPPELRAALAEMGYDPAGLGQAGEAPATTPTGSNFFALFSGPAKGVLSQANRKAARARETSIGPAQLILAALEGEPDLQNQCGLTITRARQAVAGKTRDLTEVRIRPVPADAALLEFLASLPSGAGSVALLGACHGPQGTPELSELLGRHMVTPALLERCAGVFPEPAPGA